jgi:hydrogenase/urease accessory protein HupE
MPTPTTRAVLAATLLTATPMTWAHAALLDGGLLANLLHLLTQSDHLAMLAAAAVAVALGRRIASSKRSR